MEDKPSDTEFVLIGACLPRTGTLTLKVALETLLPGKCLHGLTSFLHEKEWIDLYCGNMSDEDFKHFLTSNSYSAAVDIPFAFIYDRALKVFPEAKVILSVRDADKWVKSMEETVLNMFSYSPAVFFLRFFPRYLSGFEWDDSLRCWPYHLQRIVFRNSVRSKEMLKYFQQGKGAEYFNKWICEVEATVPENKLLKFDVKEGWGPLCKHLDVPIPDIPFPTVNSTKQFKFYANRNWRRSWLLLYELISIPIWVYGLYTKCCKS